VEVLRLSIISETGQFDRSSMPTSQPPRAATHASRRALLHLSASCKQVGCFKRYSLPMQVFTPDRNLQTHSYILPFVIDCLPTLPLSAHFCKVVIEHLLRIPKCTSGPLLVNTMMCGLSRWTRNTWIPMSLSFVRSGPKLTCR
jgi:hypothetical protein